MDPLLVNMTSEGGALSKVVAWYTGLDLLVLGTTSEAGVLLGGIDE